MRRSIYRKLFRINAFLFWINKEKKIMKQAIQVKNQLDVEELNKLFADGYEVESVDDNGIYILTKKDNIKKSDIKTEMTADITLDNTGAQRAFDLLGEAVEQIKAGSFKPEPIRELSRDEINKINRKIIEKSLATSKAKQPHIRIEFDDIRDVPKVWVDGERDYDYNNKHTIAIIKEL